MQWNSFTLWQLSYNYNYIFMIFSFFIIKRTMVSQNPLIKDVNLTSDVMYLPRTTNRTLFIIFKILKLFEKISTHLFFFSWKCDNMKKIVTSDHYTRLSPSRQYWTKYILECSHRAFNSIISYHPYMLTIKFTCYD